MQAGAVAEGQVQSRRQKEDAVVVLDVVLCLARTTIRSIVGSAFVIITPLC